MRRLILWGLMLVFVWVLVSRQTDIERLADTLARGQWQWILIAVLLQCIYYLVYATVYRFAFRAVEIERTLHDLVPVLLGSLFVSVLVPGAGMSGSALFVDDALRRGESLARATAGVVLAISADLVMFAVVLSIGMAYLFTQHDLKTYETVGALLLLGLIGGLSGVLMIGLWLPSLLHGILQWLQEAASKLAYRFQRRPLLPDDWAEKTASEFAGAASAVRAHPRRLANTLFAALAAHALDLATLYVLFFAFRHSIDFGPLVAGYDMGILFWIVSPTPEGIGVVEGVMMLVYTSLDVPGSMALVVSVAFRGVTFWLPLLLGFFVIRKTESFRSEGSTWQQNLGVHAVALLVAGVGLIDVLSAVTPALANRAEILREFLPEGARHGARIAAALAGFGLLRLANGLWRRKRVAWLLAILLLGVSAITHMLKGLDYEESVLAAVLAAWLWSLRHRFHALSDQPSMQQGLRALIAALLFIVIYGATGFYLLDRHFKIHYSLILALKQTVTMFAQFYNPGLEPATRYGNHFISSIYVVGAVTMGYALLMLLRPVLVRRPATSEEREMAKAIVEAYGRSSLARFTLLSDKLYYFGPGGSVVAYAVVSRAAVALGDPIGPPDSIAAAITGFAGHSARNDWQPAFFQTLPDHLENYRAAGFQTLCVGYEAIVELASFTLEGKENKNLRSAVNHMTKLGFHTELHRPPLSDDLLRALRAVSDGWLTMTKGTEKRFSLGWFDDDYICNSPVMAVHAPAGAITAFANIVPEYQINEITIDLMRHQPQAEHGTMDFLFAELFQWAKVEGYAAFNLGLSPLAGVGEKPEDPAVERAAHLIYEHMNRFYSFAGVRAFKEKFHPVWSPRYLVYPDPASLPSVVMAIVRADSGGSIIAAFIGGM